MTDTLSLIEGSQAGNVRDTETLLEFIRTNHMPRRIRKFVRRNVLVEQDEIESQFLEGCWRAVAKAKLDIGNPLMFICWKGELSVIHLFKKKIREGVRVHCAVCGTGSLTYKAKEKRASCTACGSTEVETFMITKDESQMTVDAESGVALLDWDHTQPDKLHGQMDDQFSRVTYDIQVEEIRSKLSGRVLALFDKLVIENINRDTSANYLEEIGTEWGVTTACVSIYLRKLRQRVALFFPNNPLVAPKVSAVAA